MEAFQLLEIKSSLHMVFKALFIHSIVLSSPISITSLLFITLDVCISNHHAPFNFKPSKDSKSKSSTCIVCVYLVARSYLTLCDLMDCSPPRF